MPIIYELNNRVKKKYNDKKVAIIDDEKRVHMAHIDIHYGYSVNGVAYLHTEILKNSELNHLIIRQMALRSGDGCCIAIKSWPLW